jgi:hypothetical protein
MMRVHAARKGAYIIADTFDQVADSFAPITCACPIATVHSSFDEGTASSLRSQHPTAIGWRHCHASMRPRRQRRDHLICLMGAVRSQTLQ